MQLKKLMNFKLKDVMLMIAEFLTVFCTDERRIYNIQRISIIVNIGLCKMEEHLEDKLKNHEVLIKGKGIKQNRYHQWDVYDHSIKVVEHVKKSGADNTLIVAAYLHDLGKVINAQPRKDKNGVVQKDSLGNNYHVFDSPKRHEQTGAEYVENEISQEYFDEFGVDKNEVVELVRHHFLPMTHIKKMYEAKSLEEMTQHYNNLVKKLDEVPVDKDKLMTLFYADTLAKSEDNKDQENIIMIYEHLMNNKHSMEDIYNKHNEMKGTK